MDQEAAFKLTFVIPCYNEEFRLDSNSYISSLGNNPTLSILFVNDGSSDDTEKVLFSLKDNFPQQVDVLSLDKNQGKSEAVRLGVKKVLSTDPDASVIGYLDADLATSLEEGFALSNILWHNEKLKFVFASRISKVGSTISRKTYRHLIGRVIATFISNILKLRVYDTQCGAKVFTRDLAAFVFEKPFISKWLFDVEIFARMLCVPEKYSENNMLEYPLDKWIDHDGSKVKWTYSFKLFFDLYKIKSSYPELRKRKNME